MNEKVEEMSKLIHFCLIKLTYPLIAFPSAIVTAINYFIYDLNDDAFYLSAVVM